MCKIILLLKHHSLSADGTMTLISVIPGLYYCSLLMGEPCEGQGAKAVRLLEETTQSVLSYALATSLSCTYIRKH